ncbi:unnamed protein product, partial [Urochloa humidicola]
RCGVSTRGPCVVSVGGGGGATRAAPYTSPPPAPYPPRRRRSEAPEAMCSPGRRRRGFFRRSGAPPPLVEQRWQLVARHQDLAWTERGLRRPDPVFGDVPAGLLPPFLQRDRDIAVHDIPVFLYMDCLPNQLHELEFDLTVVVSALQQAGGFACQFLPWRS